MSIIKGEKPCFKKFGDSWSNGLPSDTGLLQYSSAKYLVLQMFCTLSGSNSNGIVLSMGILELVGCRCALTRDTRIL